MEEKLLNHNLSEDQNRKEEEHKKLFGSKLKDGEVFKLTNRFDANKFDDCLFWSKSKGGSDISIRSDDYIRSEISGKWRKISDRRVLASEFEAIIKQIITNAAPGSLLKGRAIDKSYQPLDVNNNNIPHRFRMNVTAMRSLDSDAPAFAMVLRSLPTNPPTVSQLGIEDDIINNFRVHNGLNLVTGGTGSGKSTLIYSLLRHILSDSNIYDHILDYSRPIEYTMDGLDFPNSFLSQTEVGLHLRNSDSNTETAAWQEAVRNALRRKPNHIVIGESRDKPTFDSVLTAANTGHLATTTLHTNGCAASIQRALRFYSFEERLGVGTDLISFLNIIVNQMLVPNFDNTRKYALREYIIFNDYVKSRITSIDNVDKWPAEVQNIMNEFSGQPNAPVKCMTMLDHAKKRFKDKEIGIDSLKIVQNMARGHKEALQTIGTQQQRDVEFNELISNGEDE